MKVNEIFLSVQGEGLTAGFPTIFIRFTGCNLRCSYCDTTYAYEEGQELTADGVFKHILKFPYKRVCLTGGEPLLQNDLQKLLNLLHQYSVTIETNGSIDISKFSLGKGHSFVMDAKTPSSNFSHMLNQDNFNYLSDRDEIKFVIGNREDYEWSKVILKQFYKEGTATFSPIYGQIKYSDLAEWILQDGLDVHFQIQMHKVIWDPSQRGV